MNFKKLNFLIKFLGGVIFIGLIISLIWFLFLQLEPKRSLIMNINQKQKGMIRNALITLPQPKTKSSISIEEALFKRRSVREYQDQPLTLEEISQILWSAQGITSPEGGRTTPSAGALYPLELYLAIRKGKEIEPGVYHYLPETHQLTKIFTGDINNNLARAALGQSHIREAAVNLIFSAVFSRTTKKYGERGIRYVWMEAGHAAQNVYLEVQSLGLGTVVVGAFNDKEVKKILNLPPEEEPLYIMPIGRPEY